MDTSGWWELGVVWENRRDVRELLKIVRSYEVLL